MIPLNNLQCGRFRGRDGLDLVDQADVRGPLPLAVDEGTLR